MLALGAGLDARELVRDGIVDGLIVADLEMQERMMLDGAPMAADRAYREPMKLIAPAIQRPLRLAITSRIRSAMFCADAANRIRA